MTATLEKPSPLAEALREELRRVLEDDGQPFTALVARRVYDVAIASKDLLVAAAGKTTASTVASILDNQGPLENLTAPGAITAPAIAAETFGARMLRELLAILPSLRPKLPLANEEPEDPKALVQAIAQARQLGMSDVAEELEHKLFGHALEGARPVNLNDPEAGSWEEGYADGHINKPPDSQTPEYQAGYLKGTEARFLGPGDHSPPPAAALSGETENPS